MKVIGSIAILFLSVGILWGMFDRKFLPLTLVGFAFVGLYFYGLKGEH